MSYTRCGRNLWAKLDTAINSLSANHACLKTLCIARIHRPETYHRHRGTMRYWGESRQRGKQGSLLLLVDRPPDTKACLCMTTVDTVAVYCWICGSAKLLKIARTDRPNTIGYTKTASRALGREADDAG